MTLRSSQDLNLGLLNGGWFMTPHAEWLLIPKFAGTAVKGALVLIMVSVGTHHAEWLLIPCSLGLQ